MSNSNGKSFQEQWAFINFVKQQLNAASYDLRPLPENFKSGRPKWECLFFSGDRKLIERRLALELVSKRTGRPYHVCERESSPSHLRREAPRPASTAQSHGYTLNDVFENDELPPPLPPPLPLRRETTADYLP